MNMYTIGAGPLLYWPFWLSFCFTPFLPLAINQWHAWKRFSQKLWLCARPTKATRKKWTKKWWLFTRRKRSIRLEVVYQCWFRYRYLFPYIGFCCHRLKFAMHLGFFGFMIWPCQIPTTFCRSLWRYQCMFKPSWIQRHQIQYRQKWCFICRSFFPSCSFSSRPDWFCIG